MTDARLFPGGSTAEPSRGIDDVVAALADLRLQPTNDEYAIHDAIADALGEAGIEYDHEARIGPRCRIDFLVTGGIGIEVKKGKPNAREVAEQLERYAASDAVAALVLVVGQSVWGHPSEVRGKPVRYIGLSKLWGIGI